MPSFFRYKFFGPTAAAVKPPVVAADLDDLLAALVQALKDDPTLAAVVGNRIYPEHPPASAALLSSLCYEVVSERRSYSLTGASGLPVVRVRLTAISLNFADVSAVRKRLRDWFDGFRGTLGGIPVAFCQFADVHDRYRNPIPGADKGSYLRFIDLKFTLRESLPSNR
jgi:hypothetical protein